MKTQRPKQIKVVDKERDELLEELDVKKFQLKENEARLNGGYSKALNKDVLSVDEEIKVLKRAIRIREIRKEKPTILTPYYEYERDSEYCSLMMVEDNEKLENHRKVLKLVEKQKEKILSDEPILKARITEIEKELKMDKK